MSTPDDEKQATPPAYERLPFDPHDRKKVRRRIKSFGWVIALLLVIDAGFMVLIWVADKENGFGAHLGFSIGIGVLVLAGMGIVFWNARRELRDLAAGYKLRYDGPLHMTYFAGTRSTPYLTISFGDKNLRTTRSPFLRIGRAADFVPLFPYWGVIEFTPSAGDVLAMTAPEWGGEIRA